MDAAKMFTLSRELAGASITDYPDTRLLPFLNNVKDDFFAYLITGAGEDWNWDIWTTTSIVNQTEYVIPEAASDTEGNLKINSISINYDGKTYDDGRLKYKKAKLVSPSSLPEHWNYYINNQSKDSPIYFIADQSIFIAPTPKQGETGNTSIELKGIKSIPDYVVDESETNIKIPSYLHNNLVQGILPYIHRSQGRKDDASFEEKKYREDRDLAVNKFSNRATSPTYMSFPSNINQQSDTYTLNLN